MPWDLLLGLIAPQHPKAGPKGGPPPMPLEVTLRGYLRQNWSALSDPAAEETLYDRAAMRHFAGIELGDDRIPDETTILNFRHLLERHGLSEAIFAEVNAHLADKGYVSAEREAAFVGPGKVLGIMRKAPTGSPQEPLDVQINHIIVKVRARVEHPFRVIKRQFGPVKTRYQGLARNRAQLFTLFALGTLFLVRKSLMAGGQACSKMDGPPQKRPQNLEISELCQKTASPQRSEGHPGEAEGVDQTFLNIKRF